MKDGVPRSSVAAVASGEMLKPIISGKGLHYIPFIVMCKSAEFFFVGKISMNFGH